MGKTKKKGKGQQRMNPMSLVSNGGSSFCGDLARAQERLRALVDEACRTLDAATLNLTAFTLAAHLDHELGQLRCRTEIISHELDHEAASMKIALHAMEKQL
jgi:hypothetical protein